MQGMEEEEVNVMKISQKYLSSIFLFNQIRFQLCLSSLLFDFPLFSFKKLNLSIKPLFRITLACIGLSWLVIGTSTVGLLPNSRWPQNMTYPKKESLCASHAMLTVLVVTLLFRIKSWLSEWVHVMCYRICARGLSATICYHNRWIQPTHQEPK